MQAALQQHTPPARITRPLLIAIDPGQKGALAIQTHSQLQCLPMPESPRELKLYLQQVLEQNHVRNTEPHPLVEVFLEKQSGCAGIRTSAPAMFKFGTQYGIILGLCEALNLRLRLVTPQQWMRALNLGRRGPLSRQEWKRKLKAEAERLYPGLQVTLQNADALLMLEYAKRQYAYD